ncbi:DUF4360 domain-containing protein [Actinoplanes sp. NPDC051859]|uniref:DUF4360 domain-containing protein n=1 Tax=Actinoplanes sp. NPDC051859 TaxID=3363909 RepID=UPI0037B2952E
MKERLVGGRRAVLAVVGTVLALSLATPAAAVAGPAAVQGVPDGNVHVEVIAANGSGCAPGTAAVYGNHDKTGFRVRYYDFEAEAGGDASPTARRKNCQLGVLVTVPAGWTFAVAQTEYRGRLKINGGATGLQKTNYYWQGSSANNRTEDSFAGPLNGYWATNDQAGGLVYLPCQDQKVLNINTELRVDAGTSSGKSTMSMKSSEGDVDTLFNFAWIRC